MQKVVEFREKHGQGVAQGLGARSLVWVGDKYDITPPAAVQVGAQTLTPGRVPKNTADKAVTPLQAAMNRSEAPEMPVDNFATAFQSTMNFEGKEPVMLASNLWPTNEPIKLPTPAPGPDGAPVIAGNG